MLCILTGFDPFDNASVNPSQQAVDRVADRIELGSGVRSIEVSKLVLPTCCDLSWELLDKHIRMRADSHDKFIVILSGYAHKRERITPERYALNVRDYRIADNRGHQFDEQPIEAGAPELLRTEVPLKQLTQRLMNKGFLAETSYHAGTFVCNDVYYRALRQWSLDARCGGVLFMHFPQPQNYATVFKDLSAPKQQDNDVQAPEIDPIEHFALALRETIIFVCERALATEPAPTGG